MLRMSSRYTLELWFEREETGWGERFSPANPCKETAFRSVLQWGLNGSNERWKTLKKIFPPESWNVAWESPRKWLGPASRKTGTGNNRSLDLVCGQEKGPANQGRVFCKDRGKGAANAGGQKTCQWFLRGIFWPTSRYLVASSRQPPVPSCPTQPR